MAIDPKKWGDQRGNSIDITNEFSNCTLESVSLSLVNTDDGWRIIINLDEETTLLKMSDLYTISERSQLLLGMVALHLNTTADHLREVIIKAYADIENSAV